MTPESTSRKRPSDGFDDNNTTKKQRTDSQTGVMNGREVTNDESVKRRPLILYFNAFQMLTRSETLSLALSSKATYYSCIDWTRDKVQQMLRDKCTLFANSMKNTQYQAVGETIVGMADALQTIDGSSLLMIYREATKLEYRILTFIDESLDSKALCQINPPLPQIGLDWIKIAICMNSIKECRLEKNLQLYSKTILDKTNMLKPDEFIVLTKWLVDFHEKEVQDGNDFPSNCLDTLLRNYFSFLQQQNQYITLAYLLAELGTRIQSSVIDVDQLGLPSCITMLVEDDVERISIYQFLLYNQNSLSPLVLNYLKAALYTYNLEKQCADLKFPHFICAETINMEFSVSSIKNGLVLFTLKKHITMLLNEMDDSISDIDTPDTTRWNLIKLAFSLAIEIDCPELRRVYFKELANELENDPLLEVYLAVFCTSLKEEYLAALTKSSNSSS